jgi:hypothetical protein
VKQNKEDATKLALHISKLVETVVRVVEKSPSISNDMGTQLAVFRESVFPHSPPKAPF